MSLEVNNNFWTSLFFKDWSFVYFDLLAGVRSVRTRVSWSFLFILICLQVSDLCVRESQLEPADRFCLLRFACRCQICAYASRNSSQLIVFVYFDLLAGVRSVRTRAATRASWSFLFTLICLQVSDLCVREPQLEPADRFCLLWFACSCQICAYASRNSSQLIMFVYFDLLAGVRSVRTRAATRASWSFLFTLICLQVSDLCVREPQLEPADRFCLLWFACRCQICAYASRNSSQLIVFVYFDLLAGVRSVRTRAATRASWSFLFTLICLQVSDLCVREPQLEPADRVCLLWFACRCQNCAYASRNSSQLIVFVYFDLLAGVRSVRTRASWSFLFTLICLQVSDLCVLEPADRFCLLWFACRCQICAYASRNSSQLIVFVYFDLLTGVRSVRTRVATRASWSCLFTLICLQVSDLCVCEPQLEPADRVCLLWFACRCQICAYASRNSSQLIVFVYFDLLAGVRSVRTRAATRASWSCLFTSICLQVSDLCVRESQLEPADRVCLLWFACRCQICAYASRNSSQLIVFVYFDLLAGVRSVRTRATTRASWSCLFTLICLQVSDLCVCEPQLEPADRAPAHAHRGQSVPVQCVRCQVQDQLRPQAPHEDPHRRKTIRVRFVWLPVFC